MNSEQHASLESASGEAIALKSVHVDGRLEGLMLRVQVRQSYRNDTGNNLETVYTFPLAWGATLLGLNVELAGKRLQATVIEKKEATERYEKAIDEGDSPVMVEKSAAGLFTANLGNLKADEEAVIELEYAQQLNFEQGRIRLNIPTTVAPRYGDSHGAGGLAAHETAGVNSLVEYPLTLKLEVRGPVAQAQLSCASHKVSIAGSEQSMTVILDKGAHLDRDFVLNLEGLEGQSFAVSAPDGDHHAVLASFCPKLPAQKTAPLLLKILVDCSGSMAGDSIAQARVALHEVFRSLAPVDQVSYSRFGSTVDHLFPRLEACTPQMVATVLAPAVSYTDADMGGTEMNGALVSTFAIPTPATEGQAIVVLLITDGEVWAIDDIVATARTSGHRIFAIGVGSAPAESLLRDLAEKTGGACELVTPNEDITAAILRTFRRMRASRNVKLQVNWGATPAWQSALPRQLFDGETVHVFAELDALPGSPPTLTWELDWLSIELQPTAITADTDGTVARLAGARQMMEAPSRADAKTLALKYQLVSEQTNLFLVHVRAEEDKALGLPVLRQIEQMQAAGWGGFGTVGAGTMRFSKRASIAAPSMLSPVGIVASRIRSAPAAFRHNRNIAGSSVYPHAASGFDESMDDFAIPAFLRNQPDEGTSTGLTPAELVQALNDASLMATDFSEVFRSVLRQGVDPDVTLAIESMAKKIGNLDTAWALLINWLSVHLAGPCSLERHARRLIRTQLVGVGDDVRTHYAKRFASALPGVSHDTWGRVSVTLMDKIAQRVKGIAG